MQYTIDTYLGRELPCGDNYPASLGRELMFRVRVNAEVSLSPPARTLGVELELGHVARAGPDA